MSAFSEAGRAQRGGVQGSTLAHQLQEIDLSRRATLRADHDDAPVHGQRLNVAREAGAAHHIEDHVGPATVGGEFVLKMQDL